MRFNDDEKKNVNHSSLYVLMEKEAGNKQKQNWQHTFFLTDSKYNMVIMKISKMPAQGSRILLFSHVRSVVKVNAINILGDTDFSSGNHPGEKPLRMDA